MLKKTGKVRKIHDLVELGRDADFPEDMMGNIKELTLAYVYSRYPDVKQSSNLKEKASDFLERAREVLKWVEENL